MARASGRQVIGFFLLTFAGTWACWLLVLRLGGLPFEMGPWNGPRALVLLGTFMPAIVAMALTAAREGRAGLRTLLSRLFRADVHAGWYAFAILYWFAIQLAAGVIHRAAWGTWPRFNADPWPLMLAAALFSTLIGGQAGEEIGWRGYALPRLAARMGLRAASILLGILWGVWHLPLFYMPGADLHGQSLPFYVVVTTALSVTMAWVYAGTRGSLLVTMLMHAAINNFRPFSLGRVDPGDPLSVSRAPFPWLAAAVASVVAVILLVRMRGADAAAIDGGGPARDAQGARALR